MLEALIVKLLGLNWRDKIQPASYRGVKFFVIRTETGIGRRNIVHQYPFRNEPYVEDLGLDADQFTVDGYIIASKENSYDYFIDRDRLISALSMKGGGELIHPYLGSKTVSLVGKARMTETFEEGGIARFTMTFITTGINRYPTSDYDYVQGIDNQSELTEAACQDSFGAKFAALGDSLATLNNIVKKLYSAQRKIMAAIQGGPRSLISTALGYIDSSAANTFDSTMASACGTASLILSSYGAFKNAGGIIGDFTDNILEGVCSGMITSRKTGVNRPSTSQQGTIDQDLGKSMIVNMIEILIFANEVNPTKIVSLSTAQESANREHLENFIRNTGLTAITQIAARIDYSSTNDATYIMKLVNDAIDSQLDILGDNVDSAQYTSYGLSIEDDESYLAMKDLRKVFTKSMQGIAAKLPSITEYKVTNGALPALVLAYNQYKDLNRETQIIKRNQIKMAHPGFMPGGETIEILSY